MSKQESKIHLKSHLTKVILSYKINIYAHILKTLKEKTKDDSLGSL